MWSEKLISDSSGMWRLNTSLQVSRDCSSLNLKDRIHVVCCRAPPELNRYRNTK